MLGRIIMGNYCRVFRRGAFRKFKRERSRATLAVRGVRGDFSGGRGGTRHGKSRAGFGF